MRMAPALSLLLAATAAAQQPALSRRDSGLVAGILAAEDRRDSTAAALGEGLRHRDERIQLIANRALGRRRDARFASRDSFPTPPAAPKYEDPAWRLRYRALNAKPPACDVVVRALADSAWPVRLRAADVAPKECSSGVLATLRAWANSDTPDARRSRGGISWHARAHALVALARLAPEDGRRALAPAAGSRVPWLRTYAAHAAGILADSATLRRLARDRNDNVREAAIEELAKTAGHAADDVYIDALSARGYQVIRAAANALKGSRDTARVAAAARAAWIRLAVDTLETAKDARMAVGDRMREFHSADAAVLGLVQPVPLGRDAVRLALGEDVRLRVTLADSSGGGSFVVRLRGDVAPIMAARILELAKSHWYDGRTWYRVEPDFVIQGGGPGSNEYVGHPRFLRDELGTLQHVRGTVGMSTRGHDTGDAQWFINLRDNQRLTRDYTVFGEVVEGIDVVDGILEGDVIQRIEVIGSTKPPRR
jgi:cyclophilin family peptidyl-prolyl cis-trans isomerase